MGDRTTWFENCPNCGGEDTVECYEALSSNMKMKSCDKCDFNMRYDIDDTKNVITITPIYPNLVAQPLNQPKSSHDGLENDNAE